MLLVVAGLFGRTLNNIRQEQVGFEIGHLVTFTLDPSSSGYGEDRTLQIINSAIETLGGLPGVKGVAGTTDPELVGDTNTSNYSIQGYKPAEEENMNFEQPRITPGYFATLHQAILAGREFTVADAPDEGFPFVRGEEEHRALLVLRVADRDLLADEGNLNASVGVAVAAFPPRLLGNFQYCFASLSFQSSAVMVGKSCFVAAGSSAAARR